MSKPSGLQQAIVFGAGVLVSLLCVAFVYWAQDVHKPQFYAVGFPAQMPWAERFKILRAADARLADVGRYEGLVIVYAEHTGQSLPERLRALGIHAVMPVGVVTFCLPPAGV